MDWRSWSLKAGEDPHLSYGVYSPRDIISDRLLAGRRNIAASAQIPQIAPAIVQSFLLRPLYLAMTQQRIASRKCTSATVRHNTVASISDLMKKSPE
jgi:hypothetical protein